MILLFDAANTIIHKPSFFVRLKGVLHNYGYEIDITTLQFTHKLLSESYHFPDRTSQHFYKDFNKEFLYAIGIISTEKMLDDIFEACSYLPWEKFEDTASLGELQCKKVIISNFHNGLKEIIRTHFGNGFSDIYISENEKCRKPEQEFYINVIENLKADPSEIIYIGDSIKLDLEPGLKAGMNAWLIDRENYFPCCSRKIRSLRDIKNLI